MAKRKRPAVNPYGIAVDPALALGDAPLSPSLPPWMPAFSMRNEWEDWADPTRPLFDLQDNQFVPPLPPPAVPPPTEVRRRADRALPPAITLLRHSPSATCPMPRPPPARLAAPRHSPNLRRLP